MTRPSYRIAAAEGAANFHSTTECRGQIVMWAWAILDDAQIFKDVPDMGDPCSVPQAVAVFAP